MMLNQSSKRMPGVQAAFALRSNNSSSTSSSCSSSSSRRCRARSTRPSQRSTRPSQRPSQRAVIVCIHKEYAAQGAAQQHGSSGQDAAAWRVVQQQQLLSTPEDVVLECLTVLRRGEIAVLEPYLPTARLAPPGAAVLLAGVPVHEQGPLARCAPFMDTAARRVLPGHLLRRARVLSSLCVGGSCLLRVALTACTGEEATLVWQLGLHGLPGITAAAAAAGGGSRQEVQQQQQQQQQQQGQVEQQQHQVEQQQGQEAAAGQLASEQGGSSHVTQQQEQQQQQQQLQQQEQLQRPDLLQATAATTTTTSSSRGVGGSATPPRPCWQVLSVSRDTSNDAEGLPSSPHPRLAPEQVVLAQLSALRGQQLLAACAFNLMGRRASSSGWDAHLQAFGRLLQQQPYALLVGRAAQGPDAAWRAELGGSALPSQRQFLQEVVLHPPHGPARSSSSSSSGSGSSTGAEVMPQRFLWRLGMQADGCWMVRSIEVL